MSVNINLLFIILVIYLKCMYVSLLDILTKSYYDTRVLCLLLFQALSTETILMKIHEGIVYFISNQ